MCMDDSSVDDKNGLYVDDSSFCTIGNTVAEIEQSRIKTWRKLHTRAQGTECLSTKLRQNICLCAQDGIEWVNKLP